MGKTTSYDDLQDGWTHIFYSVFESVREPGTDDWVVTDNRDEIAYQGTAVVVAAKSVWIEDNGKDYRSTQLTNPTWRTLAEHADKSIPITKDSHHVFFEGFYVKWTDEGVELHLIFGS